MYLHSVNLAVLMKNSTLWRGNWSLNPWFQASTPK